MKKLRSGLILVLSLASLAVTSPGAFAATISAADADGTPHLLTDLQFNSTASTGSTVVGNTAPVAMVSTTSTVSTASIALSYPGWGFGARNGGTLSVEPTASPLSNGTSVYALKGTYPVAGTGAWYVYADYDMANLKSEDVYIEFWAKMPGATGGCKFVKIFSDQTSTVASSHATIWTDYTGGMDGWGGIPQVEFGDGTYLHNDAQNSIYLNGNNPQAIGRSYGTAVVKTPQMSPFMASDWGNSWHHFRIHVKFNSGTTSQNEVPNGEIYLEIDGKVYIDATGLYNRSPASGPISMIAFYGWAQKDPEPFQLWYYDIRISTGGFLPQVAPVPPGNVVVK